MAQKRKFTEVCILDICTSDYFIGYQFPVIAVPVYKNMTNKEVAYFIQLEIDLTYDYLRESFSKKDIELFDKYCEELLTKPENENFSYLEELDEEENDLYESCYLYISLCCPVFSYGMKFLNE